MAGKQTIDELISEKAFQQEERLLKGLSDLNAEFTISINKAKQLSDTLAGAKSLSQINRDSAKAAQELEKLNRLIAQTATAQQNLERATTQNAQATIRATQADERRAAQLERQESAVKKASSAYNSLNAVYRAVTEEARNAGVQFGVTSYQFQELSQQANGLRARLDAIDQPLGNYQRNVGNYRGAFDGLGNSVQQLSREFPAFAVSVQTGILALSNNLPIFFDQIQRTREEVAALRAEGQQTPGVFRRIVTSLTSPIGLLTLGVTLLTIYGKEIGNFIQALFKGKKAIDEFAERQKALNDVFKDGNRDAANQLTSLKYLYAAATDVANAMGERVEAAKELQKEFPKTFGLQQQENIINGEAIDIYKEQIVQIKALARAKAAQNKISSEVAKQLDAEVQIEKINNANQRETLSLQSKITKAEGDLRSGRSGGFRGVGLPASYASDIKLSNKRASEAIKEQNEIIKRAQNNIDAVEKIAGGATAIGNGIGEGGAGSKASGDSLLLQQLKLSQAQLKNIQEANKAVFDDDTQTFDARLSALDRYNKASEKLITIDKDIKLQAEDLTATQIATIQTEADGEQANRIIENNNNKEKLQADANKQLVALIKQGQKEIEDAEKENYDRSKRIIEDSGLAQLEAIQANSEDALIALEKQYAAGKITKKDYENQKLDIEYQANSDAIKAQIETVKRLLEIQEAAGIDVSESKKRLSALTRSLSKADADYEIAQLKTVKEAREELSERAKELAGEVFSFGVSLVNAQYENEKNRIQEQSDAIDVRKDKEIAEVDRSILTEQQKADKIAIINAKAKAQQDVLDARKREVAARQAKFDKAIALANIVQNTYAGAARALKDYPFPFSSIIAGLVVGIGLAQAAQIIATPIPKYAEGTDYHKGGPLIYGERGTELVIEPNGKQYLTPDSATLSTAPAGTKVITNDEVVRMLAKPDRVNYVGGQSVDISKLIASTDRTTKAIQSQRINTTIITKRGFAKQQKTISDWGKYRNERLN